MRLCYTHFGQTLKHCELISFLCYHKRIQQAIMKCYLNFICQTVSFYSSLNDSKLTMRHRSATKTPLLSSQTPLQELQLRFQISAVINLNTLNQRKQLYLKTLIRTSQLHIFQPASNSINNQPVRKSHCWDSAETVIIHATVATRLLHFPTKTLE